MSLGAKYDSEEQRIAIEKIRRWVRWHKNLIMQEWYCTREYKQRGDLNVIRIGHLPTLRFIELPREQIPEGLEVTQAFLDEFMKAAYVGEKSIKGLFVYD